MKGLFIVITLFACMQANAARNITVRVPGDCKDIQTAITKAAELRKRAGEGSDVTIKIAKGIYRISRPLSIGGGDFGKEAGASSLSIVGAGPGRTIISGAVELPPFRESGGGLWECDLSSVMPSGGSIDQLYVNDRKAILAQTPDSGKFFVTGRVTEVVPSDAERNLTFDGKCIQTMEMSSEAAEALKKVKEGSRLMTTILYSWQSITKYVVWYDTGRGLFSVDGDRMRSYCPYDVSSQFVFKNDRAFLDSPGEYFYDEDAAMLFYCPRPGETLKNTAAFLPSPAHLLEITGSEENRVSNVSISGLCLEHSRFSFGRKGRGPQQAAADVDAAVMVDYATGVTIQNCEIRHTGNAGIWFREACRDCSITDCYLHDIGAGGIKIGTIRIPEDEDACLTRRVNVENNVIREGGRVLETAVGITLLNASDCNISHNDISDFFYSGISLGWVWGYDHSPSKRNIVTYNHIHHLGMGVLSDMGGIYTVGRSEGTVISHNIIHDINAYTYGGWGLYCDQGSSGIVMENNLVFNCKSASFHFHFGKDNIVRNNILVDGLVAQLEAARYEPDLSFTFTGNIISFKEGNMYANGWAIANSVVDSNLYWYDGKEVTFNGLSFDKWKDSTGRDRHSVIADPVFKDMGFGRFMPTAVPVLDRIGFKTFDLEDVGVHLVSGPVLSPWNNPGK